MSTMNLGKVRIDPKGTWSSANSYEFLNTVYDTGTGSSYMALQNVPTGTAITNTDYWEMLCRGFAETDVTNAVNAWLVAHPEATTTVQDNSITDAKLVQTGGVLEEVADLKSAFNEITNTVNKEVYTDVVAVNNHVGNRVYYTTQYNRIAQTDAGETRAYSVYAVTKGKYRIYGYGFDSEQGAFAVVGDADLIASGSASVGLLQVIETGKSAYGWYTVEAEINQDGFLYVNYQTAQNPKVEAIASETKYTTDKNGIYISNGEYYHFHATKGTNLIRKFVRRGVNNLFQWAGTYTGSVDENGLTIESTIDVYSTDIIGPLSIWNNTLWPNVYGMWAGGNHGKNIDGTVYPTAEQADFACLVDGVEVSTDGLYYGDVIFNVKNKLYFPQSITGADLTSATQALNEYRAYYLDSKMHVKVRLEFVEDTRISTYYGMQAVTVAYDTISAFNNNFCKSKADITESLNLTQTENKISLHNETTGLTLDMELMPVGMGNYQFNAGTGTGASAGYVYIPIQTGSNRTEKVYYMLAINTSAEKVKSGMSLFWEGKYSLYFE